MAEKTGKIASTIPSPFAAIVCGIEASRVAHKIERRLRAEALGTVVVRETDLWRKFGTDI